MRGAVSDAAPMPPLEKPEIERLFHHARALVHRLRPAAVARAGAARFERGIHPRRRPGPGDSFWQYRPFESGEPVQRIDWRRSARSDRLYVREREWETSRVLWLWVDRGPGMRFASRSGLPTKEARALLLCFVAAWLAWEAGEVVGWAGRAGGGPFARATARRLLTALAQGGDDGPLPPAAFAPGRMPARLLVIGDGLWPRAALEEATVRWRGARLEPMVVEILDPAEERFPYEGRLLLAAASAAAPEPLMVEEGRAAAPEIERRLAAHRAETEALLKAAGVAHLRLSTAIGGEAAAALLAGLLGC